MVFLNNPLGALLSAVIDRALDDLQGKHGDSRRQAEPDHAMAFILSDTCENYCYFLDLNYEALQEKAATLYRRILTKETPSYRIKKSHRKGAKPYRHIKPSHNPGKLAKGAYR